MSGRRLVTDERAVSTAVTHALSLGITALLITGLVIGSAHLLENQRKTVAGRGVENIGSAVASDILRLYRYADDAPGQDATLVSKNPKEIGATGYSIHIEEATLPSGASVARVVVETDAHNFEYVTRFEITPASGPDICQATITGGDVVIEYDASASPPCLSIRPL